ncbi:pachytene checkpoint protein 2 homolog isoform X2 [Dreissena polymorpha]|nr:pachytene checkpoint protein 2 homolog isoform X2 [Dreissena polymorpha]XP_052269479.1 pachytene checkpoint protein 2 homolog isoform X2 [Dreissena polymorpha]XP_052269480.1 pachytene checkpoint protein 2 homolog isoform X2 [Dreissena polymorpha]
MSSSVLGSSTSMADNIYHVEICRDPHSTARNEEILAHVDIFFRGRVLTTRDLHITEFDDKFLQQHVSKIEVSDIKLSQQETICTADCIFRYHIYQLHEDGPGTEELDDEDLAAANHWILPSREFHGLWESLVFDEDIKTKLLSYASTTLLFTDKQVDSNIISWNKVVLLHGPPGTGKTSLCKALAQKLCIRLSGRFTYGQLVEINSHSLFSKWFSESGKLVMKMFQKIQELIDEPQALVCVLIDEVESLTAARKSAMSGSEPSDAIRVVNAVLTQIDQIKKYPNVIILTTSNVTGAIDLAFVDRADIKQYIGPPSPSAIYSIYKSCIVELVKRGILTSGQTVLDWRSLEFMRFVENTFNRDSLQLKEISEKSHGLSGRTLRKLPFIAHAMFIQKSQASLQEFLIALDKAVQQQFKERTDLARD